MTHPHFRLVEHDIRDGAGLAARWERALPAEAPAISVVAHLAARAGPRSSLGQERLYQDINVRGTVEVLECASAIWCPAIRAHFHVIGLRQQSA